MGSMVPNISISIISSFWWRVTPSCNYLTVGEKKKDQSISIIKSAFCRAKDIVTGHTSWKITTIEIIFYMFSILTVSRCLLREKFLLQLRAPFHFWFRVNSKVNKGYCNITPCTAVFDKWIHWNAQNPKILLCEAGAFSLEKQIQLRSCLYI